MENYKPLEIKILLLWQQDIVTASNQDSLPNDGGKADIFG